MNKKELATLLNGREYGEEITKEECGLATKSGLVVVYGASDDLKNLVGHTKLKFHMRLSSSRKAMITIVGELCLTSKIYES